MDKWETTEPALPPMVRIEKEKAKKTTEGITEVDDDNEEVEDKDYTLEIVLGVIAGLLVIGLVVVGTVCFIKRKRVS